MDVFPFENAAGEWAEFSGRFRRWGAEKHIIDEIHRPDESGLISARAAKPFDEVVERYGCRGQASPFHLIQKQESEGDVWRLLRPSLDGL